MPLGKGNQRESCKATIVLLIALTVTGHNVYNVCEVTDSTEHRTQNGTAEAALVYEPSDDKSVVLSAYVDADHAGCPITSRSTTGAVYKVNGTAVHWTSKRQTTAMKSSTDAEMFGAAAATTEIMWLRDLLTSLECPQLNPMELHSDNSGVIINSNTATNRRSKHMNVKFAVVRDAKYQRKIKVVKCKSSENIANGLTKPVGPTGIAKLQRAVNLWHKTSAQNSKQGL